MIVGPVVQSSWVALQGMIHMGDGCVSNGSDSHKIINADDTLFGVRPQHQELPTRTALHAVPTRLSYKTSSTVDYINAVDMDEVVNSSVLNTENDSASPLIEYENSSFSVEDSLPQPPSIMSMLKHFQMIEEAGRVTYPHFLETVSTWGRKNHIARRIKFIDMLSPVQLDSFQSLFRVIDRDEDGLIDMFDFRAVLDSVKSDDEEEEIDSESAPRLGLNGFKKMTNDEFIGIAAEAEFYNLLVDTFKDMDAVGNGFVRVDDVSELLHSLKSICTSFDCNSKLNDLIGGRTDEEVDATKHRYVYYRNFINSLLEMNC